MSAADATYVTAVERHAAALARDLAWWKNLLTTRTNTLRARAEKAERERDEALAQIDAHLNLCGAAPMTTVTDDGTVMRVEQMHRAQNDVPIRERYFRLAPIEDPS